MKSNEMIMGHDIHRRQYMRTGKGRGIVTALVAIALVAAACSSSPAASKGTSGATSGGVFRIASPIDLTGSDVGLSVPWQSSLRAAAAEVNSHGGIDGRKVVIDFENVESNPALAAQTTTQMLSTGKYSALIPTAGGTESLPIMQAAKKYNVLVVGTGTLANWGNPKVYPNAFNTNFSPQEIGQETACLAKGLNAKNVGIIYIGDQAFSQTEVPVMETKLKSLGISVASAQGFPFASTDVTAQLTKIEAAHPDLILVSAYVTALQTVFSGLKTLGITTPVAGDSQTAFSPPGGYITPGSLPAKFPAIGYGAQTLQKGGVLTANQKTAIKYLKQQIKTFAVSLTGYAYIYDALMYVAWAGNHAHSTTTKAMRTALESLKAHPENTGALNQPMPPFSPTNHGVADGTFYAINALATPVNGTQPELFSLSGC